MKINLDERIEASGLVPVRVLNAPSAKTEMFARGDLDYFLRSIKAIGERAVFISEIGFDDSYFLYQSVSEVEDDYGAGKHPSDENALTNIQFN